MIIGIVGKMQSGKDTVGKIIQMLTDNLLEGIPEEAVEDCVLNTPILNPSFKIVKFADKLKDMVCLLIGCTRADLEDDSFKDTELGEEWWYYIDIETGIMHPYKGFTDTYLRMFNLIKLTPRLILQLLGTQCGRQIIHPDIWINATMADYQSIAGTMDVRRSRETFPNWIITDCRFPNEAQAIKDRGGIIIKVMRDIEGRFPLLYKEWRETTYSDFYCFLREKYPAIYGKITHESEIALDNYADYDAVIDNGGFMLDTVEQVKIILKNHNIWMKEN